MKDTTIAILIILGTLALITTGLAYLFMWIGTPKWVAWMVTIVMSLSGAKVKNV